jgi:hypothetical protein
MKTRCAGFGGGLVAALTVVLAGCALGGGSGEGAPAGELGASDLRLETVSTRSYLVTGGDVLLRVELGADVDPAAVEVRANGQDVTASFHAADDGSLLGLVSGLPDGDNQIEAVAGDASAALQVTSYPISGPIISGPHEQPFFCQTQDFSTAGGATLGEPLDENCSAETRVEYVYFSPTSGEAGEFLPFDPAARATLDIPEVTTLAGATVPFIVRVETGTVNRAIYEIAMLHDPALAEPDPWTPSAGWNGKLVYTHGGGCRGGWYVQGDGTGGVLRQGLLEMGYALTSASLNVFGNNCSDLLASETHIMVKERFIERYGVPVYTIGTGSSGGSYQSHQTADNYPGIFDGIIVASSFPDVISATIFTLADARLLHHYFTAVAPGQFTEEEQRLVSGFGSWGSIPNLSQGAARIDATYTEGAADEDQGAEVNVPELEALRYSESNPTGPRATVYDHTVNALGVDEATGFAGRPLDNAGVQYGLAALNRGEISKAQFIALNRDIGGYDADLNHVPERHRASPEAARRATSTGRILFGGGGLASTPVIDYRSYTDHREGGDIHMIVHQFTTRARLAAANGHSDNHVMNVGGLFDFTEAEPDLGVIFRQMDQWLTNLVADDGTSPRSERVVAAKPADAVDNCWDSQGEGRVNIREPLSADGTGRCSEIFPVYDTPRTVAGAPLTNQIVSCHLKPLDPADYEVEFTAEEWASLGEVFPDGVCDWSRGDQHAAPYQGTWLSFGPSPVNLAQ